MSVQQTVTVRKLLVLELVNVAFVQRESAFNELEVEVDGKVVAVLDEAQLHEFYFRLGQFLTHVNYTNQGWKSTVFPDNVEITNEPLGSYQPGLF